jgi:hypothetical protein
LVLHSLQKLRRRGPESPREPQRAPESPRQPQTAPREFPEPQRAPESSQSFRESQKWGMPHVAQCRIADLIAICGAGGLLA